MLLQIYAIIDPGEDEGLMVNTIKNVSENLEIFSFKNVIVVISKTTQVTEVSKESVLLYSNIISKLSEYITLIPFRFGSIIESYDKIIEIIINNNDTIINLLKELKNREEYSVRVMRSNNNDDHGCAQDQKKKENEIPFSIKGLTPNKIYLNGLYKKYINEKKRSEHLEEVRGYALTEIAKITKKVLIKENKNPAFILDSVILIERKQKSELLELAIAFKKYYFKHNIIITGPWPPYNFININI